jgi:benzoyl-CoA reductase subunit C
VKKIAYFDSSNDMPEEVISAAGFVPYKIFGDVHASNDPADMYLPKFTCPAARSWLTEALSNSRDWEGIIVANGCDATNRQYDIWKAHVNTPFLYWINCPVKDDAIAFKFYKQELLRMIKRIEEHFSIEITIDKLFEAIKMSNEVKVRLQKLSALRLQKDIPNRDYFNILKKSLQSPKEELREELDSILMEWESRPEFPKNKKRILLTGSDITYVEWMDILEECDLRVVRDDLSVGERYFTNLIPKDHDSLNALIKFHFDMPKPATRVGMAGRIEFLSKILKESPIDAILSQNLKFCEPYAFDSVLVNNAIKEKGYKIIHLEREFTPMRQEQIINRLAAFKEML